MHVNRSSVCTLVKFESFNAKLWWMAKNWGREESDIFTTSAIKKSEIPFLHGRYLYTKENDLFQPKLLDAGLNVIDFLSALFITQAVSPQRSLLIRWMVSSKSHMVWGIYITQYPIDFLQKRGKPKNTHTVSYLQATKNVRAAGVQYWTTFTLSKL